MKKIFKKIYNSLFKKATPDEGNLTEEEYYTKLFVKDKKWSQKGPNKDEALRLAAIGEMISDVQVYWNENEVISPQIIDFGCGRGWLSNKLRTYGEVTGIEPVANVVEYGRELYPNLKLVVGSLELLTKHNPDLIVSSEVIEHIPDNQKAAFFQAFYDALKPGGFSVITTPRQEALQDWLKIKTVNQPVEEWLTEEEVKKYALMAGFTVKKSSRINVNMNASDNIDLYQVWLFQKEARQSF